MSDTKVITIEDKSIEVKLSSRSILVTKVPLKKYKEIFSKLDNIPKQFDKITITTESELIAILPGIITNSLDEFQAIASIATGLTVEDLGELSIYELAVVVQAIIEVNRYTEAYEVLKNVLARPASAPETTSTEQ